MEASFDMGGIRFSGLLRPSQVDASKAIDEGLGLGSKKLILLPRLVLEKQFLDCIRGAI